MRLTTLRCRLGGKDHTAKVTHNDLISLAETGLALKLVNAANRDKYDKTDNAAWLRELYNVTEVKK